MRTLLATAVLLTLGLGVGCLSEEDVTRAIEDAGYCSEDSDCVVIYPGCPLGCFSAVNRAEVESVEAKIERYHGQQSTECLYDCAAHTDPWCEAGQCIVEVDELY